MKTMNNESRASQSWLTLEVRMARAAHLLNNVVLPIKTIASDCGYTVVSNFYRDFKRVYGTSPLKMRLVHLDIQLLDQPPAVREDSLQAFERRSA